MYYFWEADFANETFYTRASIQNPKALIGIKLIAGLPLIGKLPEVRVEVTSSHPPADYFSAGPIFIVSERLKSLLNEYGSNVEYHPITLLRDGHELKSASYFFANLLEKIDCLDRDMSTYRLDGEFIDKIESLVIDEHKTGRKPLFRLAMTYDVITLVSQDLKDVITAAGITGVNLLSLSDWK